MKNFFCIPKSVGDIFDVRKKNAHSDFEIREETKRRNLQARKRMEQMAFEVLKKDMDELSKYELSILDTSFPY